MGNAGWIKLHRDIREHWVYEDPLLFKIWLSVLLIANHEERKIFINGQMFNVQRGQFWTSIRKFSAQLNMNKDTVRKKLLLLQSDGMIYMDSRKGIGTLITVCNYALYQGFSSGSVDTSSDTKSDTEWDKPQTHRGTLRSHKQEYKNDKNDKEIKNNSGLPPADAFEEV